MLTVMRSGLAFDSAGNLSIPRLLLCRALDWPQQHGSRSMESADASDGLDFPALDTWRSACRQSHRVVVLVTRDGDPPVPALLLDAADVILAPGGTAVTGAVEVAGPAGGGARPGRADRGVRACVGGARLVSLRVGLSRPSVPAAVAAESSVYSTPQSGPGVQGLAGVARAHPATPVRASASECAGTWMSCASRSLARDGGNATTPPVRDALRNALEIARWDPALRVTLDGDGPGYCAGGDLDEFGSAPDPATAHLLRVAASVGLLVHELRDRVTVRVHGDCVGAGIEVPAFARWIVAAPGSRFRLPEVAMGLVPGAGGTVGVPRRIGRSRAAWLALAGGTIDAGTAQRWGLIDAIE